MQLKLSEIIPNEKDRNSIKLFLEIKKDHYVLLYRNTDGRMLIYICRDTIALSNNSFWVDETYNYGVGNANLLSEEAAKHNLTGKEGYGLTNHWIELMSEDKRTGWSWKKIDKYE